MKKLRLDFKQLSSDHTSQKCHDRKIYVWLNRYVTSSVIYAGVFYSFHKYLLSFFNIQGIVFPICHFSYFKDQLTFRLVNYNFLL